MKKPFGGYMPPLTSKEESPEIEELQTKLANEAEEQRIADFKADLLTKPGRRRMWVLIERTGVLRQSFTGNSETFFKEGQRDIGLRYLAELIDLCPELFIKMLEDLIEDRRLREVRLNAVRAKSVSKFHSDSGEPN